MQYLKGIKLTIFCLMVLQTSNLSAGNADSIKWKERNNKIIHHSVCYNHAKGSLKYRQCKAKAKNYFVQQCRYFTKKYQTTKHPYRVEYKKSRTKFCYSARNFGLVG